MNCPDHHLNPISLICLSNHKCQRKLCVECQYDHGVDIKLTDPLNKFQEKMEKKLQSQKLIESSSEINELRICFKQLLSKTDITMKKLWEDISESIKQIFDIIEQENQTYIDLIKKNENLAQSSYQDLEMLVNILVGKTLDDWNSQKNTNLQKLQQVQTWLESEVKNFSTKLTAQITQINSIIKNQNQEQYVWKEGTQEHIGIIWDYEYDPPRSKKTKFQITFTKNKQILYMRDGQILRTEQFKDISKKPEVLTNLEQIQNLQWVGEYGKNKFKVGNWKAIWIEQTLKDVAGLYSIEGKKQGLWKDIIKNFWSQAQAFEIGEYTNDQRKGIWKQIYMDKELGSGEYNNQGEKYGKWIELSEGFNQHSQVLYNGEYKNGKKVGRWEIFYKGKYEKKFTKIGGGSYDEGGSNKIGFWMKKLFIGGGSQDEGSIKIGRWVELSEEFYDDSQVTNNGEYKNGKKVGMWDIVAWGRKIGGGSYTEGDSTKIGSWIELSEGFKYNSQVTYKGEYKCGRKTGRWDLIFNGKLIGGGLYKEVEGDSIKVGNWIEMNDQFWENFQVIYTGEYNKIGQKVGKWVEIDLEINKQLKEIKYDN